MTNFRDEKQKEYFIKHGKSDSADFMYVADSLFEYSHNNLMKDKNLKRAKK